MAGPEASSRNKGALVTLDPLSYRRTKRSERQKPWNEQRPKSSPRPHQLELHYDAFLPRNKELKYRTREYVTNPRYGQLYEVCREENPKPAAKENSVSWLWEDQFRLWQLDMAWHDSNKQKFGKRTDSKVLQARVKDVAGRHVATRTSNSVPSDAKPHADLFAAYHNQLLSTQRRQVAAIVIQRYFRGWRTRMRLARLKRRVLLELGRPWPKVLEEYWELVSRVQARHGVMRTGFRFSLTDMEEYVDRRHRYERAFENMAADGKLSSDQLENFLKECGHYPTKGELNKAFNSVFKGSGSTAELVFVLDCSTSVGADSFHDQMTFVKEVVRSLHVAPHRVRVGVVPYNTDVFQAFGLLQHSSGQEVIEAVDKIRFQPGLTLTDKGLRIMRDIFKDARPGVQKVSVVITDGQSDNKTKTALEAKRAREENITIFAIGVGHEVDLQELQEIAGDVSRVSLCSDYRSLLQLRDLVGTKLCLRSDQLSEAKCHSGDALLSDASTAEGRGFDTRMREGEDGGRTSTSPLGVRERIRIRDAGSRNAQQGKVSGAGNGGSRNPSGRRTEHDENEKIFDDDILSSLASSPDKAVIIFETPEAAIDSARWASGAYSVSDNGRDHKSKTDISEDARENGANSSKSSFCPSGARNSLDDSRGCTPVTANDAADIIWTIYPPRAARLPARQSRWIRPVVGGEEAWSFLDDSIIKATDFKICLGLVIKAKLEREGAVTLPSDVRDGVETVSSYEEAMEKIEQYIQKRKKMENRAAVSVSSDLLNY